MLILTNFHLGRCCCCLEVTVHKVKQLHDVYKSSTDNTLNSQQSSETSDANISTNKNTFNPYPIMHLQAVLPFLWPVFTEAMHRLRYFPCAFFLWFSTRYFLQLLTSKVFTIWESCSFTAEAALSPQREYKLCYAHLIWWLLNVPEFSI